MSIDEEILAAIAPVNGRAAPSIEFATLVAVTADGSVLVAPAGAKHAPLAARSLVALRPEDAGRDVVVAIVGGRRPQPVVLGLLQSPASAGTEVVADGRKVVVRARQELVLECGKASITLSRAGKVTIKGEYVLSRATGVNRVQGGSVQIN